MWSYWINVDSLFLFIDFNREIMSEMGEMGVLGATIEGRYDAK